MAENGVNRVTGGASFTYDIRVAQPAEHLPARCPTRSPRSTTSAGSATTGASTPPPAWRSRRRCPPPGLAYQVAALDPQIQVGQLRDSTAATGDLWPQLKVPGGMSPSIKQTALEVTAEATTAYDKALALQRWFTREGGFTYSTSVQERRRRRLHRGVPRRARRLLRAVRRRDGRHGPHAGHPLARRRRLHPGRRGRDGPVARHRARRARLAGAVVRRGRLGAVRADAALRRRRC